MPTYDFECRSCGERFERNAPVDTQSAECPACGSEDSKRHFGGFGVVSRQMTSYQKRRLEDKRGIDRDGARTRFKEARKQARKPGT